MKSQVLVVTKPGCPACEETKPVIKKIKKKVSFAEINADSHPSVVEKLGVQAFPDFVYTNRTGKVFHMPWNGVPNVANVERWIDEAKRGSASSTPARKNTCKECGADGNGVSPRIWGPPIWYAIHTLALMYPRTPTATEKKEMKDFFFGLQKVLPCTYCKDHFAQELAGLDPDTFRNRDSLFEWTVAFHESVTQRVSKWHPEMAQPRHTVNYWRKHYKLIALYHAKKTLAKKQKPT